MENVTFFEAFGWVHHDGHLNDVHMILNGVVNQIRFERTNKWKLYFISGFVVSSFKSLTRYLYVHSLVDNYKDTHNFRCDLERRVLSDCAILPLSLTVSIFGEYNVIFRMLMNEHLWELGASVAKSFTYRRHVEHKIQRFYCERKNMWHIRLK